jgi:hypothetical protein
MPLDREQLPTLLQSPYQSDKEKPQAIKVGIQVESPGKKEQTPDRTISQAINPSTSFLKKLDHRLKKLDKKLN